MAGHDKRARNPLVAKLLQFTPLSDEDIRVLETLCSSEKRFKGGVDIWAEADAISLSPPGQPAVTASCRTAGDRS